MNDQRNLLDELKSPYKRRRDILPWWIKIFIWIFLIFGAIAPLGIILGIAGFQFQSTLYGLQTNEPLSFIGISIFTLMFFKGIVAFALWNEFDWAVLTAIIDAIIGILICLLVMIIPSLSLQTASGFRIEVLILVPYLVYLFRIKKTWQLTHN